MTHYTRRAALALTSMAIANTANAQAMFLGGQGIALRGFDPVAYWTLEIARKGKIDFESEIDEVTWWFSSKRHKDLFDENPKKYIPQYGGFDAESIARGYVRVSDPSVFVIVKDKLYLHYSVEVQNRWAQNIIGNIDIADENWPELSEIYED